MARSNKRRHGAKQDVGKRDRVGETATIVRLVLVVWELIWTLAHEHFTNCPGRIL
jgi:hypothetical protein